MKLEEKRVLLDVLWETRLFYQKPTCFGMESIQELPKDEILWLAVGWAKSVPLKKKTNGEGNSSFRMRSLVGHPRIGDLFREVVASLALVYGSESWAHPEPAHATWSRPLQPIVSHIPSANFIKLGVENQAGDPKQ